MRFVGSCTVGFGVYMSLLFFFNTVTSIVVRSDVVNSVIGPIPNIHPPSTGMKSPISPMMSALVGESPEMRYVRADVVMS